MPFDLQAQRKAALTRQGKTSIMQYPVSAKFGIIVFPASFLVNTGGLSVEDGSLIFDRGGTLMISKLDYPAGIAEQSKVAVQQSDTTWLIFNVEGVTGVESPTATEVQIVIGPLSK